MKKLLFLLAVLCAQGLMSQIPVRGKFFSLFGKSKKQEAAKPGGQAKSERPESDKKKSRKEWEEGERKERQTGAYLPSIPSKRFKKAQRFPEQLASLSMPMPLCNGGNAWSQVGPFSMNKQNIGVIQAVAMDPNNSAIIYAASFKGGLFKTINGGSTWTNISDGNTFTQGSGVNDIIIDPSNSNILYITCSGNNLFDQESGILDDSPYSLLVYKSTNGGSSWSLTGLTPAANTRIQIHKLIISPTGKLFAFGKLRTTTANTFMVYKSTDGGNTWSSFNTNIAAGINWSFAASYPHWGEVKFDLGNENNIFAAIALEGQLPILMRTINGGTTWQNIPLPDPSPDCAGVIGIDTKAGNPGVFYTLTHILGGGLDELRIHSTNDNGQTYTLINSCPDLNFTYGTNGGVSEPLVNCPVGAFDIGTGCQFGYWQGNFLVSDNLANTFYISDIYVWKSTNSGASYVNTTEYYPSATTLGTHADVRIMKKYPSINAGQDVLLIGTDGGVALSTNSGASWTNINGNGLGVAQSIGVDFFEPTNEVITGAEHIGTVLNRNNNTWVHVKNGDGNPPAVDNSKPGRVYMGANGYFSYSNTKGDCIVLDMSQTQPTGFGPQTKPTIDPNNVDNVFFHHMGEKVVKYNSLNNTWTTVFDITNYSGSGITNAFAVAKGNANLMFVAMEYPTWGPASKKIFKSTNAGASWTDITTAFSLPNNTLYSWNYVLDLAIDPNNHDHIMAALAGYDATRIVESWNGGSTWVNRSAGLPGFPVNKILFQEGTTAIWAGTNVGVYLSGNGSNSWSCFNMNLPSVAITDLKINACHGKLIAATKGRGIWQADLPPVSGYIHTLTTIDPQGLINWSGYTSIGNDIEIPVGKKLHLYGVLSMAQGKSIIVNAGAQLVLHNGSKITNNCNHTWQGIQVAGVNTAIQNTQQGLVSITSATIEHAQAAIRTKQNTSVPTLIANSAGGIIQANSAYFLNNKNSIDFLPYSGATSVSFFNKCVFNTTQALRDNAIPDNHVRISKVKNIKFNGCYFGYNAGSTYPVGQRYRGIYVSDAHIVIDQICNSLLTPCTSYLKCTFENLDYGIFFTSANRLQFPKIYNSVFQNNSLGGIRIEGSDYPEIITNTVTTANRNGSYGVYLDQCSFYKVENNTFSGITSQTNFQTGMFINKSGTLSNLVYRNNFNNLYQGCAALKTNASFNSNIGLQIKCSNFTSNKYDVAIMGDQNLAGIIKPGQGTTASPVGNIYSAVCGNGNRYYKNAYSPQFTIHYSNSSPSSTQPSPQPGCSPVSVLISAGSGAYNANTNCPNLQPATTSGNPPPNQMMATINSNLAAVQTQYSSQKANYNSVIDGGNTTLVFSTINSNISNSSLKTFLAQRSPYLSDQALSAYFSKGGVPTTDIVDIHNLNKPVSETIYSQLQSMSLPTSVFATIQQQQQLSPVSKRDSIQEPIADLESQMSSLVNDKVRMYLTDSVLQDPDSVVFILSNDFTRGNNQSGLVLAYINKGDFASAQTVLSTMRAANVMLDFCDLYDVIVALTQYPENWYQLTSNTSLKAAVEAIANQIDNPLSKNAQAMLVEVFGYDYSSEFIYPDEEIGERSTEQTDNKGQISEELLENGVKIKIYPNPADQSVSIDLPGITETIDIEITDMLGRSVKTFTITPDSSRINIVTSNFVNGLYSFTLHTKNKKLHVNNKLSVLH